MQEEKILLHHKRWISFLSGDFTNDVWLWKLLFKNQNRLPTKKTLEAFINRFSKLQKYFDLKTSWVRSIFNKIKFTILVEELT